MNKTLPIFHMFACFLLFVTTIQAQDIEITVENVRNLEVLYTFKTEPTVVGDILFNYDDTLIATHHIGSDIIQLRASEDGKLVQELIAERAFGDVVMGRTYNFGVTFAPFDEGKEIVVWDLTQMSPSQQIVLPEEGVMFDLQLSYDDTTILLSGCYKSRRCGIMIWDISTEDYNKIELPEGHAILGYSISPDGRTLAILHRSEEGNEISLWDTSEYQRLKSIPLEKNVSYITYSIDSNKIISAYNNILSGIIWDIQSDEIEPLSDLYYTEFVSAGYIFLIPKIIDDIAYAVRIDTDEIIAPIPFLKAGDSTFNTEVPLSFSPDGSIYVNASVINGKNLVLFGLGNDEVWFKQNVFKSAFSNNGHLFVTYNLLDGEFSVMGVRDS
jgi:hypothetical protein